ncbi:MAG: phage tail fiber protein [Candidatus Nanoarchaeia archaeon]
MGDFAHYLSSNILDYIFGLENYSPPITMYLGLSTTTVNDDGTGVTEPDAPSYSRISINNNKIVWSAAEVSEGKSSLKNVSEFEFNTATESWGTIVSWFISDSESSGNVLTYGTLDPSITIDENNRLIIPAEAITITLD